ncbi:MAG: bifunctional methylenetetrahydrofolate dehydrogenase/methenyltetrahydrofolate cyclohydrolase FolD [Pseudomonadota bacterium]
MAKQPTETSQDSRVIDGKAAAAALRARIAEAVATLKSDHGLTPGLAVILVGDNPASQVYVRNKAKQTREVGMASFEHVLPATTSQEALHSLIRQLNDDPAVHGILVQLPLPSPLDEAAAIATIDPRKDVDGLTAINAGRLLAGRPGLVPCTPLGCLLLARQTLGDLAGLNAVVVGRSILVGKPMAHLLLRENCTVTMAHSRTRDLADLCRHADLLIAAVGRPRMMTPDYVRPGATVIDVGINRVDAPDKGEGGTRLVGDVDFEPVYEVAGHITPVPGGVGPMTIACLLRNTLQAASAQHGVPMPSL